MKQPRWTNEAVLGLALLTPPQRQGLFELFDLIVQFPAMHPKRQRGPFAGLRYFVLQRRWLVYYRHTEAAGVLILAIVPALARPR